MNKQIWFLWSYVDNAVQPFAELEYALKNIETVQENIDFREDIHWKLFRGQTVDMGEFD